MKKDRDRRAHVQGDAGQRQVVHPGGRAGGRRGGDRRRPHGGARRSRARRVRAGRPARCGAHPAGHARDLGRGSDPRQVQPRGRLLRRRHPFGLRRQDHAGARLHRRGLGRRRVQPLEGRGPGLGGAAGPHPRAAQPLPAPPAPPRGGGERPAQAARLQGAPARAPAAWARPPPCTWPPPGWAPSGSSTWTWSTPPTCSARSCTTRTGSASARSTRPRRRSRCSTPTSNVVTYDVRLGADNILDIIDGYDVIVDGTDNFPTRYLVNDASLLKRIPVVHGSIFRFEGQATVFDPYDGPLLPVHDPRAAAGRAGPELRRGRRAGRPARHRRLDPGRRGHQDAPRRRRPPRRVGCSPTTRWSSRFRTFKVHRDPQCPACGPDAGEHRDRRVRRPVHAPRARAAGRRLSRPVGPARRSGRVGRRWAPVPSTVAAPLERSP